MDRYPLKAVETGSQECDEDAVAVAVAAVAVAVLAADREMLIASPPISLVMPRSKKAMAFLNCTPTDTVFSAAPKTITHANAAIRLSRER